MKVKERIPFTGTWKAKYREKISKAKMDDKALLDKEVKHRRTLYQLSLSSGFYIGLHAISAAASSGATIAVAAIQLSWQAFMAIQTSWKHKMCTEEIFRRGLEPRNMTTAEKVKTAFWASLSVAFSQAIDGIASNAIENSCSENVATSFSNVMNTMASDPGAVMSEVAAQGGGYAAGIVMDMMAAGTLASAGIAVAKGAKVMANSSWVRERSMLMQSQARGTVPGAKSSFITVQTTCIECHRQFSTPMITNMIRICSGCQMNTFMRKEEKHEDRDSRTETETLIGDDEETKIASLHLGVFCDGCCDGIIGSRFQCAECDDFDLCERCFHADVFRMHTGCHAFEEFSSNATVKSTKMLFLECESVLPLASDIFCDNCQDDIVGMHARCTVCPYFDLCKACYAGEAGRDHNNEHPFEYTM